MQIIRIVAMSASSLDMWPVVDIGRDQEQLKREATHSASKHIEVHHEFYVGSYRRS